MAMAADALGGESTFTFAERHLLMAVPLGETGAGASAGDYIDPADADRWPDSRNVRPSLIRWLCASPEAVRQMHDNGLRLFAARLSGPLNLSFASIPFPLSFHHCNLISGINISDAEVGRLSFRHCQVGPVRGDRASLEGSLVFAEGTRVLGGVRLQGATVHGNLALNGAHLINSGAVAFAGNGLHVTGSLYMGTDFRALGAVRLTRSVIAGSLDTRGGSFINQSGPALSCDGIQVGGAVHMD